MTTILNNFSAGTDGATITTGNSGGASGAAFNGLGASGANTLVYDDDFDFGGGINHSALIVGTGTRTLAWTTAWPAASTVWISGVFVLDDATPAAALSLINIFETDEATVGCSLRLNVDGRLQLRAPATVRYTSLAAMENNVPFRVRLKVVSSPTVGRISGEIYKGDNLWGTTPDETFGSDTTNWDTGDGQVGGVAFGMLGDPTASLNLHIAAVGISDAGPVPPLGEAPDLPTPLDVPGSWALTASPGLRQLTASWTAVPEADEGYSIQIQSLNPGQDGDQDSEWTTLGTFSVPSAATVALVLDDGDGIDWARTYRGRIRALTAQDN